MGIRTRAMAMVGAALCLLVIGCAPAPGGVTGPAPAWREPVRPGDSRNRSTVLDSPRQHHVQASAGIDTASTLAWYEGRNDIQPATYAGYSSSTFEVVHTREYDRQRHSSGRIYDYHNSTTRRESISTSVR